MFVPLAHPPGHAQADFGEAIAIIGGVEQKAHFFVMVVIGSAIGPSDNGDAAQRRLLRPGLSCRDGGGLDGRPCPCLSLLWRGASLGAP